MRTGLVVLILAVIALALFNPDMEDFQLFVETHTAEIIRSEVGDGAIPEALAQIGSSLAAQHIDRVTERRNYVVFSTYTIDLDDRDNGNEWRFLGMAGHFLKLEGGESENGGGR